jgi:hypothetical protein
LLRQEFTCGNHGVGDLFDQVQRLAAFRRHPTRDHAFSGISGEGIPLQMVDDRRTNALPGFGSWIVWHEALSNLSTR